MGAYAIGVDFGTLSGRALLVDVATGEELAVADAPYAHGVMDTALPDGTPLGLDWALQHPQDYLDVLEAIIPAVLDKAGIAADAVIGVGLDCTASTLLPVKVDGTPLCFLPAYASTPHAYAMLWKHHAAQDKANAMREVAEKMGETWLARYGGKVSSEWAFPKIWQVLDEAPEVYAAADYFVEAGDWLVWQLTGAQTRNACMAGYKAFYHSREGYPSKAFFAALDPRLENVIEEKLNCPILPQGAKAGEISAPGAARTGLKEGTAVAVSCIDAHVTMPSVKISEPGSMLAIMGTSTCHILVSREEKAVPGICGVVENGVYPGYYGYEAGQSCVGDHFAWFVKNCVPAEYTQAAMARGMDIHAYLSERARAFSPGESGLIALDWWNGNRSVLVDVDLTGLIVGMTLQTRPEEIYRALMEATAFGTRKIIETFRAAGVPVNAFYASGGISQKNPVMMQLYADILRLPIHIAGSLQGPALGSAIFGAVAAGKARGGYATVFEAMESMGKLRDEVYTPAEENAEVYDALYAEYTELHDFFGRGGNDIMKRLKAVKRKSRKERVSQ